MCTHANPITNVTTKTKVPKIKLAPIVRPRKKLLEDGRSFMEMSMYRIKKYFKNEAKSNT